MQVRQTSRAAKKRRSVIFGRSSSEIQALITASCEFEVIPGISSALSAPLLAGIPLTDPVMSRCFAVMSAHEPDALEWEALVQIETLVILMGGRNLSEIVWQLQKQDDRPKLRSPLSEIAAAPNSKFGCAPLPTWYRKQQVNLYRLA